MVSSYSSGSSFTSSSLSRPPTYTHSSAGPSSAWAPSATSPTAATGSQEPPALDLGPPGYEATIVLYPETKDERTVYLGPWQVTVSPEGVCIVWQCSYAGEVLEHYISVESQADIYPHTSHAHHRPYHEPSDMERSVTFTDSHHIRYTNDEGEIIHDQPITARYEFTSVDASRQFQSDLRAKELVTFYDVDVAWTDVHDRTDTFGQVRGIAVGQRVKLWRDPITSYYSITILANKLPGRPYIEYDVPVFERDIRDKKEHKKQVQISTRKRRDSGSESTGRRFSFSRRQRTGSGSSAESSSSTTSKREREIRHLFFRFSRREGYRAFTQSWSTLHAETTHAAIPFQPQSYQLATPELSPPSTSTRRPSSHISPFTQASSSYQISPNTQASSGFTQASSASYTSHTSYNTSHGSYASSPEIEHPASRHRGTE